MHIPMYPSKGLLLKYVKEIVAVGVDQESTQVALSSLVQRFIYVDKTHDVNPLTVVPWNDAIHWALFGKMAAETEKNYIPLVTLRFLRRSLEDELGPLFLLFRNGYEEYEKGRTTRYGPIDYVHKAIAEGNDLVMRDMLDCEMVNYTWEEMAGMALLESAQAGGLPKVTRYLNSSNVNTRDGYQRTSLHLASAQCDLATVEFLLSFGADTSLRDWFGHTALNGLVSRLKDLGKGIETAKLLLHNNKALLDQPDFRGCTPLHTAVQYKSLDFVELLLDHGAAVDSKDSFGFTPHDLSVGMAGILRSSNLISKTLEEALPRATPR